MMGVVLCGMWIQVLEYMGWAVRVYEVYTRCMWVGSVVYVGAILHICF